MEIEEYRAYLQERLSPERFYHSECVSEESARLAKTYGADVKIAREAGLLHDCCKEMPIGDQLKYLKSCDILLDKAVFDNTFVWHGITGSYYIQKEFGVTNSEIINAVKNHTTARAKMSLIEEIVFLADYISVDRKYPKADEIRKYVSASKELAIVKCLEHGLAKCIENNQALVKDSVEAYNYYLLLLKQEDVNY